MQYFIPTYGEVEIIVVLLNIEPQTLALSYTLCSLPAASRIACNAARRAPSFGRLLATSTAVRAPAVLPDLSYDYGELEPAISGEIMKIHHTKHHQASQPFLAAAEIIGTNPK